MSVTKGNKIDASTYVSLKNSIKSEMKRRGLQEGKAKNCSVGSLSAYSGSAYDYTTVPATDGSIKSEHIQKIQTPLHAANSGYSSAVGNATSITADQINNALKALADLTGKSATSSAHGCSGACSGLCSSGCYSACSSCSGCTGCSGTCNTTCTGGCKSGCSGGCSGSCKTTCSGGCDTECDSSCTENCANDCYAACASGCGQCSVNCFPSCTMHGKWEW